MRTTLLIAALACSTGVAFTQETGKKKPPLTKEQLERLEALDHLQATAESLEKQLDALMITRKAACLKAFGHESFCTCLNDKLVVGLTFDMYVGAVIHSKAELGYATVSAKDKELIDNAILIRDTCVASVWSK